MVYERIKAEIIAENKRMCTNTLEAIEKREEILRRESTDTRWEQYITKKITYPELVRFTTDRIEKKYQKLLKQDLDLLEEIEDAKIPDKIVIKVNWTKSSVWGYNPHAEIIDEKNKFFGSASGSGYDKESAAVAEALNQSMPCLKILCDEKEAQLEKGYTENNHNLIGYGSGYSAIPKFEGGVGVSCFRNILDNCGYIWEDYSGKNYNLYIATKKIYEDEEV